jgi:thiamine biosynthesis lipoprotein
MGTQFRIILYSQDSTSAQNIANQCFKRVDQLNHILSDYDLSSELSQLAKTSGIGKKVKVSKDLWQVIKTAQKIAKKSKGAFDLSIGPLSKLWRSMFRKKTIFNAEKIKAMQAKVNYKNIKLYGLTKRVKLKQTGMLLDAGGIAKGYTVDEMVKILKKHGLTQFLVDGGGDLYIGAPPPHEEGWKIQVLIDAKNGTNSNKTLYLKNIAIASSGDTYRYLEWEGKRYSHIIDPRTGYGLNHRKILNVSAPNCMVADAAASALSVMTAAESQRFLKKIKKIALIQ